MSEEQPKEAEETVYQRDKTAKGPNIEEPESVPVPPKIKPRKVFVPKKVKEDLSKPMERRTRHILMSTAETANLIRDTIIDYQQELAIEPSDDPDKEYEDRKKVEAFFGRVAKKYSSCLTKSMGGDLGWIKPDMELVDDTLNPELIDAVGKTLKFDIPEPVKTKRGYHLILVCETRAIEVKEKSTEMDPRYEAMMQRPDAQKPTRSDIPT